MVFKIFKHLNVFCIPNLRSISKKSSLYINIGTPVNLNLISEGISSTFFLILPFFNSNSPDLKICRPIYKVGFISESSDRVFYTIEKLFAYPIFTRPLWKLYHATSVWTRWKFALIRRYYCPVSKSMLRLAIKRVFR